MRFRRGRRRSSFGRGRRMFRGRRSMRRMRRGRRGGGVLRIGHRM